MPGDVPYSKWIIVALLALHVGWIANHMRMVAGGLINPWRLGGYAMYTVPPPVARMVVLDAAMPETPAPVNLGRYIAVQRFTNPGRVFRCAHITADAIKALIYENRNLIGRNIALVVSENEFVRNPPGVSRRIKGIVKIGWSDMKTFHFVSEFCGTKHAETAQWQE